MMNTVQMEIIMMNACSLQKTAEIKKNPKMYPPYINTGAKIIKYF